MAPSESPFDDVTGVSIAVVPVVVVAEASDISVGSLLDVAPVDTPLLVVAFAEVSSKELPRPGISTFVDKKIGSLLSTPGIGSAVTARLGTIIGVPSKKAMVAIVDMTSPLSSTNVTAPAVYTVSV
jgi:hypothetical protein